MKIVCKLRQWIENANKVFKVLNGNLFTMMRAQLYHFRWCNVKLMRIECALLSPFELNWIESKLILLLLGSNNHTNKHKNARFHAEFAKSTLTFVIKLFFVCACVCYLHAGGNLYLVDGFRLTVVIWDWTTS